MERMTTNKDKKTDLISAPESVDAEVVAKPSRRRFPAAYKLRVLEERISNSAKAGADERHRVPGLTRQRPTRPGPPVHEGFSRSAACASAPDLRIEEISLLPVTDPSPVGGAV